ncbi:MAG: DUF72 domain-containing protein [Myxococcota bacterium]
MERGTLSEGDRPRNSGESYVGTSGFSYQDWRGFFYPGEMQPAEFLAFYARHFRTCELNFTYYRIPDARTLGRMVEKSGGTVAFTLKAFQGMTHKRNATREEISAFIEALSPLRDAGVCGALLLQFPFSFKRGEKSLAYVDTLANHLRARWADVPLVTEFRHRSWVSEASFAWLQARALGLCAVDEPRLENLMPPVAVSTGPVGYVRFHGRNAEKWWNHDRPEERYDYRYPEAELRAWVPKIRAIAGASGKTFVFFNNHFQAKAADNARELVGLLAGAGETSGARGGPDRLDPPEGAG